MSLLISGNNKGNTVYQAFKKGPVQMDFSFIYLSYEEIVKFWIYSNTFYFFIIFYYGVHLNALICLKLSCM